MPLFFIVAPLNWRKWRRQSSPSLRTISTIYRKNRQINNRRQWFGYKSKNWKLSRDGRRFRNYHACGTPYLYLHLLSNIQNQNNWFESQKRQEVLVSIWCPSVPRRFSLLSELVWDYIWMKYRNAVIRNEQIAKGFLVASCSSKYKQKVRYLALKYSLEFRKR